MRIATLLLICGFLLACGDESGPGEGDRAPFATGGGSASGLSNGVCLDGTNLDDPSRLTVGLACSGLIDAFADVEFNFDATDTATYTIFLTKTQSDLSWELSVDASFNNFVCDNFLVNGPNDEICSTAERTGFTLTSSVTYYLLVSEWEVVSGTFSLLIQPDPP